MHSVATPRFLPCALSAWISVTMMRAPLAPIGWPSAQAPPWMLTRSCDTSSSCISAIGTTAKASLTSQRSTSLTVQPVFLNSLATAPTGAVENHSGCCACVAWPTMRAIGFAPIFFACDSVIMTSAAAPSLIDELEAAVMVPFSFLNAGLSVGILSSLTLPGPSSMAISVSPPRPLTVTGTISSLNRPVSVAFLARSTLAMAKASCCSRVNLYLAAQSSPKVPIERPGW